MKNQPFLRMAGIGLFGVTFLSPGSIQNDLFISKNDPRPLTTTQEFVLSAISQEANYPKKRNLSLRPCSSIQITQECEIAKNISGTQKSARSRKNRYKTPKNIRLQINTISLAKKNNDTIPALTNIEDTSTIIYDEYIEKKMTYASMPLAGIYATSIANTDSIIPPPTEYIDKEEYTISDSKTKSPIPIISTAPEDGLDSYSEDQMQNRIRLLTKYSQRFNYSPKYAFLINLGLKSGKKRFFIIDLQRGSIIQSGLVAHGRGKEKFTLKKKYSNKSGSSCSSLGLYKVGASYYGNFGKSFRLIGLEETNNNALSRAIVLHAMNCIPDEEINYPICQSEGCPSVSPFFLTKISEIIKSSSKPILIWVFDPAVDEGHEL